MLAQLGGEPGDVAAIARQIAGGDLAVPIALREGDQRSLLFAIQWAGMSLLLWSALPVVDPHWAWVLWAWPLAWALLALVLGVIFKMLGRPAFFPRIREQIQLDVIALRQTRQA